MKRLKNWLEHRTFSLKVLLVICFLIMTMIPLLVQAEFMASYFRQSQIERAMMEAQNKCVMLTNKMKSSDYITNTNNNVANPALDAELNVTASLSNGRIVVIDGSFRIIRDTFDVGKGKTVVVEDVLKAFNGETSSRRNREKDYYSMTLPIYKKETPDGALTETSEEKAVAGVLLMTVSTENMMLLAEEVLHKVGFLQLVIFVLVVALDILMVSLLLKPFIRLKQQVNVVAEGDLDQEIAVDVYTETRDISDTFSRTLGRLKSIDQSRQEFVSNVSHELKTPITSIRVLADSLQGMEDAPVELYREFMEDISDEIDREAKIIEDLLTLVRMDRSTPDLNIATVSINTLIEQILKRLRPIAKKRNIEVVYESVREVKADVDEVKLSLALTNLVENAIKYNQEEGWVHVTLDADHKFFYVKVIDNGVGIPAEFQDHVFERFYRVDKARSRETGGTGLGLAITKNIVLLHQGAIKLQSKEGEGTTFTVRIPLNYIP